MKRDGDVMSSSQGTLYKCLECGAEEVVRANDHKIDGRGCKQCKGHMSPQYFIGIDWAKDFSESTPLSKKSKKF